MSFLKTLIKTTSGGDNTYQSMQLLYDKVVGIRGIVNGVGASTIVYNLAAALADSTTYHICVLDTHILYPTLRGLLVAQTPPAKDWFDYSDNISDIVCSTKFKNVKYIGFYHRNLVDLLSTRDCRAVIDNLLPVLKEIFDVILIDLSDENSVIGINAAIQCNKIYTVVSPEPACMYGFKTSINTAVTTAVPVYKLRNVIFNKSVGTLDTPMLNMLKENHFNVMCTLPLSNEILKYNLLGNSFWGAVTRNSEITAANNALAVILKDVLEVNEKNKQFLMAEGTHNLDMSKPNTSIENIEKSVHIQTNSNLRQEVKSSENATKAVQPTSIQNKGKVQEKDVHVSMVNKPVGNSKQNVSARMLKPNASISTNVNNSTGTVMHKPNVNKPISKQNVNVTDSNK